MPRYCAVYGCMNSNAQKNDLSFFQIPRDERRAKWAKLINREDIIGTRKGHICSIHFEPRMYVNKRLNSKAVPTLHLDNCGAVTPCSCEASKSKIEDFKSYSDAESMISDNEEVTIEATSSGGRPYITIDGSTVSTGRKRPRPTAAGLSKKYKATSTQDDVDVMKLMVVDDITEPSKPVKRRVDVLLKMCRTMFREKDHEISILREQVEELTKKNVRLRNALIDMKKTATIEDTEIPEETPTSGKKSKDVKKAKVKQCKHKGDEVKVATVGTIPEPTRVKKEPVDVKIDNNIEIPRIGDEINTRSNVIEEIGQEMDPLIIKTEPVYDNERPVAVTELNYCDTEDVVAFMAGPISIEETAPDIVGLETHDVVIGDGDSESLWSTIKQEVD
ncbi:uncharacterized protein LOC113510111 isoform X6 [Galleria mellonella]|uniref:Uncharacterized protein LOC113510111 isoform X6 n=1 Tax=Galleria mellonella TaxID=7137 RepID=A0ABM3MUM7_GALME|nr:uncharacterized protein LOC113510111 isoform X6 [Galleria mellonella]